MMQVECWTTGLEEARLPPCSQIPQDQQRVKDTLERLQPKSDNDDNQSSELNEEEDEDDTGSHGELEEDSETRPELRNPRSTPFAIDSEESIGCRIPFKVDPTIDLKSHSVIDTIALAPFDSEKNLQRPLRQFPLRLRTRLAWQRHLRVCNAWRIAGKP